MRTETTIQMRATRQDDLDARQAKINKRSQKLLRTDIFSYEVLGSTMVKDRNASSIRGDTVMYEELEVRIIGEIPALGGWFLTGKIDSAGIVFGVPGAPDVPDAYRDRVGECDHCGKRRRRSETFVVTHMTGETKLVGRQCLGDHLGSTAYDPMRVWKLITDLAELSTDDEEYEFGGSGWVPTHSPMELIRTTFAAIRTHGWAPKSSFDSTPTAWLVDRALDDWHPPLKGDRDTEAQRLRKEFKAVEVDDDLCEAAFRWALEGGDSDYRQNLQKLAEMGEVGSKYYGFVCSILPSYEREIGRTVEFAKRDQEREEKNKKAFAWIGEVGEKITARVTCVDTKYINSNWGVTILCKFETEEGLRLAWFASRDPALDAQAWFTLTGTVKAHNEFKGAKETVVTRAKVVSV